MQLNVVTKLVLGFVALGCLLLFTNVISYFGLNEIKQSAEVVVNEKMPIQERMLEVQNTLLTLAKESTSGYYKQSLEGVNESHAAFGTLSDKLQGYIAGVASLVVNRQQFEKGVSQSNTYLSLSEKMYQTRKEQLNLDSQIDALAQQILRGTDEASALMMDLSYIESDSPQLDTLIGTGTNIDNKLLPMLNSVKEYVSVTDPELSDTIKGDIEFVLSNVAVDKDYLNRLAEEVDTDGVVDMFNEQFANVQSMVMSESGLFALQSNKIALLQEAQQQMEAAEDAQIQAIDVFSAIFEQVNEDAKAGQRDILEVVESNILTSVFVMIVAFIFIAVSATLVARIISRPLTKIQNSLSIISNGDLTHLADTQGQDEFSVLAQNVNQLSQSLHAVVGQMRVQADQLESATKESAQLGEKTLQQVDMQRDKVNVASNNTQTVKETSQSTLEQIRFAMEQLDNVRAQSSSASQLVTKSRQQISLVAKHSDTSSEIMQRLADNSIKIGSILDVIKTIAEQTNLLALNAAIEAARAGEQGRGFAVVADEVRTLANRTHDSTEEIETMIAALQKDSEQAVHAINEGAKQSQESVALITQVNEQVADIQSIIDKLFEVNQHIVTDTETQDRLLDEVTRELAQIVQLAKQNATYTQQSNEATHHVDKMMHQMRESVSKFTV
ncbi:methyl-accepting chemotaxis protein [Aestuariibacter sp. AA17]|uniref:Methyl-accepting chemotaxis protein n=1 Tax=Fluctibacter corallii TaxID=2984329 RepID=A0ABT3A5I3_9ALTE|nr:methyl-accepting chemotaxis protein [Aestuariibacter sp. AA17]MCV2883934.1 methyl-accepting chemotaxis protein [Aestuariibacter sp. AA17]